MLNIFPHLLVLGFFAPTLLRIGVAGVLLYMAFFYIAHREQIGRASLPFIGARGEVFAWLSALAVGILGLMLLFGYYTQVAALLTALALPKYFIYRRYWPQLLPLFFPLSRATYLLLCIICLSLLVSGAGALAFDLPL